MLSLEVFADSVIASYHIPAYRSVVGVKDTTVFLFVATLIAPRPEILFHEYKKSQSVQPLVCCM
jgi:hypothetical protein